MPGTCWKCCGCEIFTDDFNRADSSDIGSKWDEVAGGAAIVSNQLRMTTTGDLVASTTAYTTANAVVDVQIYPATAGLDATGKKCQVIIDYDDASNFHFVECRAHNSGGFDRFAFRLGKRTAGADSYLTSEAGTVQLAGGRVDVRVCITATTLSFFAEGSGGGILAGSVAITPHDGRQAALKVKESHTFDFDTFILSRHTIDDASCESCSVACGMCPESAAHDSNAPAVLRIKFQGLADNGCEDCPDHNDIWYDIPFLEAIDPDLCYWEATIASACGDGTLLVQIEIADLFDGTYQVSVDVETIGNYRVIVPDTTECWFDELEVDRIVDGACITIAPLLMTAA